MDKELDVSGLEAKFRNDRTGASAYDPRVMLKIVLLGYSRGLISSRRIEQACEHNVVFMALSGDARPSYTHIAKFVRELGGEVERLFAQVLMTCDRLGLIGRTMFAIDGVKLPGNASKERSGTHAELAHRADRLDKAAARIVALHQSQDEHAGCEIDAQRQARIEELRREARVTREFIAGHAKRTNRKGQELKTNVTDPDSAKMATSKGVIQGYAGQAAVDAQHQVIVAADVIGSGSEQAMLLPMIEKTAPVRQAHTLITADAGYFSDENISALQERAIPALIADSGMRQRDERFAEQARHKAKGEVLHDKRGTARPIGWLRPEDFCFHDAVTASCPAGKTLRGNGNVYNANGRGFQRYEADAQDCRACALRVRCLRNPNAPRGRQVARFAPADEAHPSQRMQRAIDSARGRRLYSQRIGTVEPVFANLRHHKRLNRFTLRGKSKVATQWQLYCLVHNIEKIANKARLD